MTCNAHSVLFQYLTLTMYIGLTVYLKLKNYPKALVTQCDRKRSPKIGLEPGFLQKHKLA